MMFQIRGFITGQRLEVKTLHIVSGSIDYLSAQFCFQTSDWAEMTAKFAHFSNGNDKYAVELIDDAISKEKHLNLSDGEWTVWIHGIREADGEIVERITTNQVRFFVNPTGTTDTGDVFPEAAPDVVEQLRLDVGKLDELQTNEKKSLVDAINEVLRTAEGEISAEQIAKVVEAYFAKNPTKETDPNVPEWAKKNTKPTYTAEEVGALPEDTAIPSKISDLTNDSGFITVAVADLVNYYRKSETYTQEEVNALVSAIPKFSIEVVSALPTVSISETTVYLLSTGSSNNLYTEYIYVKGNWELLGSQQVDLTGYAKQSWVLEKIGEITIPTKLSDLADDSTHRLVTDTEKEAWNNKSDFFISKNTFADGESINLPAGNSEWIASVAVSSLVVTYPSSDFEAWVKFTTAASGDISISIPLDKYIGELPEFGNGETWEISIKNGVAIAAKVEVSA